MDTMVGGLKGREAEGVLDGMPAVGPLVDLIVVGLVEGIAVGYTLGLKDGCFDACGGSRGRCGRGTACRSGSGFCRRSSSESGRNGCSSGFS